jgi:hypothetical protein
VDVHIHALRRGNAPARPFAPVARLEEVALPGRAL